MTPPTIKKGSPALGDPFDFNPGACILLVQHLAVIAEESAARRFAKIFFVCRNVAARASSFSMDLPVLLQYKSFLRSLGAGHLIDYNVEDYTRNGLQYNKILDVTAHRSVADYKRALQPGGTFTMIGGSMGGLLLQLMLLGPVISALAGKKLGVMGYRPNREDLDLLTQLFEAGKLTPVIDRHYPLDQAAEAFRYFGTGRVMGKIVIII